MNNMTNLTFFSSIMLLFHLYSHGQIRVDENLEYPRSQFDLQFYNLIYPKNPILNNINAEPRVKSICRIKNAGIKTLSIYRVKLDSLGLNDTNCIKELQFDTNGYPTAITPSIGWFGRGEPYIVKQPLNCSENQFTSKKRRFSYQITEFQTWKYDSLGRCIRHSERKAGLIHRSLAKVLATSIVKRVKCYEYSEDGLTVTVYYHFFKSIFKKEISNESEDYEIFVFDKKNNLKRRTTHTTSSALNGVVNSTETLLFLYEFH